MFALGQKRTYALQKVTSALPSKADICSALVHVCFVPIADIVDLVLGEAVRGFSRSEGMHMRC